MGTERHGFRRGAAAVFGARYTVIPLEGGAEAALREIVAGPPTDPIVALGEGPWQEVALPAGTPRIQIHVFGSLT